LNGLTVDGEVDEEVWSILSGKDSEPVLIDYEITSEDMDYRFSKSIPDDYAEKAEMEHLNYTSPEEMFAERFHMDIDLFQNLNQGKQLKAATTITVANVTGPGPEAKVARIEADTGKAQLRGYDADGELVVAYPATIGSEENPSPSGTHEVSAVAENPIYYYRPDENFKQGENADPLDIPPGPNNPVGTIWIDLSEPTYGIHGTPIPEEIDKTASHGCIRLTNWDAEELAKLVEPGIPVKFLE
jgi:lipoprotein-anchoring transpeptidase ErfK/SrfK